MVSKGCWGWPAQHAALSPDMPVLRGGGLHSRGGLGFPAPSSPPPPPIQERYQGILQAMDALGAGPAAELRGGASDPDTEGPLSPDAARLASPEGGEDAVRAKECSRGSPRGVPVQNALACLQGCSSIAGKPRPALAVSLSCGRRRCALRSYVARRTPLARGTRQLSSSGSRTVG
jgi:hypothetical protein